MAAVRARRGRGQEQAPTRGKRRKGAKHGPSPYETMPRLARIKLSGGLSPDDVQVTTKSLVLVLVGAVLFLGAGVAGAAWLGSSLFDAREAFARSADGAAATVGFAIGEVEVAAMQPQTAPGRPGQFVNRIKTANPFLQYQTLSSCYLLHIVKGNVAVL
jgi:hypothetical protein